MAAGTQLAKNVIGNAQRVLNDLQARAWGLDELLSWINEGQVRIVTLRPDAGSEVTQITLQAGVTQPMPAGSIRLLDIYGNVSGRACTFIERSAMDSFNPSWRTSTASATVKHWMYDERVPTQFEVFPPQPTSQFGKLQILRSTLPVNCTMDSVAGGTADSVIGIPDHFAWSLVDYIVYRSYSKDAEYTVRGGKADQSWMHFLQGLGIQQTTDRKYSARAAAPPHATASIPSSPGATP